MAGAHCGQRFVMKGRICARDGTPGVRGSGAAVDTFERGRATRSARLTRGLLPDGGVRCVPSHEGACSCRPLWSWCWRSQGCGGERRVGRRKPDGLSEPGPRPSW
jgi:hypothetical protein